MVGWEGGRGELCGLASLLRVPLSHGPYCPLDPGHSGSAATVPTNPPLVISL